MYKSFAFRRTEFLALLCALFLTPLFSGWPAMAQDGLFSVPDITVDVTAENALKAREQAFGEAQVQAFKVLAARMMPEGEAATFTPPDISVISGMVLDFEVTKEQLSATRYVGTYTFSFNDSAVRSYFGSRNVTYSDVKSRPALILPFLGTGNQTVLWSPFNLWMKAWSRATNLQSGLVPLIVPLGDLDDAQDIGDTEALTYKVDKLSRMLSRYEAAEAVMVVASLSAPLTTQSTDTDPASGILTIRLYRTDTATPEMMQELSLVAGQGQTLASLLDQGVANVRAALQSDWKAKTAAKSSDAAHIEAKAPLSSLNQWTQTKKALDSVYGLENLKVTTITPQFAKLDFTFRGDETRLKLALGQAGLVLVSTAPVPVPGSMPGSMPLPGSYEIYLQAFAPASTVVPAPPPAYQNLQDFRARQEQQAPAYQYHNQGSAMPAPADDPQAPTYQQRF